MTSDSDPNELRDVEIKRLAELAALAFKNAMDPELKMKTREGWYQKYTNAVLALNQLLKDSQYKDYEKRLKVIEESGRVLRRTVRLWPEMRRIARRTAGKSRTPQCARMAGGRRNA